MCQAPLDMDPKEEKKLWLHLEMYGPELFSIDTMKIEHKEQIIMSFGNAWAGLLLLFFGPHLVVLSGGGSDRPTRYAVDLKPVSGHICKAKISSSCPCASKKHNFFRKDEG